jgi:hypothetical protein
VISRVDERFRLELVQYNLRCTCEACAAFEPARESCAYGYPTGPHLRVPDAAHATEDEPALFTFCKAFELG